MRETATFRGPQVCALAGISYRQLDYWCRSGLLRPPIPARGSGSQRAFDLREVQVAWVLGQLSGLGLGLVELECLRRLPSFDGWLVVGRGTVEHVTDPDVLALWPIAVIIDLAACPIGVEYREEVPA